MRIMTLFAHPDDETLTAGGTLAKFGKENDFRVVIPFAGVAARGGHRKDEILTLREECIRAMRVFYIGDVRFGDFADNRGDGIHRLTLFKWCEKHIKDFEPDLILTHHWRCANIDHQRCHEAAMMGTRPLINKQVEIWSGETLSSTGYLRPTGFEPNLYVGLDRKQIDSKMAALAEYRSELQFHPHPRSIETAMALSILRGSESGQTYAEAFMVQRMFK